MEHGSNATFVRYPQLRGQGGIQLPARALANDRGFHAATRAGDWRMAVSPAGTGVSVEAFAGARPFVAADRTTLVHRRRRSCRG
jgi:hypothetical protein